jgi:hypothetical protein
MAQQVVEEQLGLKVDGEIRVVIKPVAYPKSRTGRPVMVAPTAPVAPADAPVTVPVTSAVASEATIDVPEPEPELEVWVPASETPAEGEASADLWAPVQEPEPEAPAADEPQADSTPFATLDAKEPPDSSPG